MGTRRPYAGWAVLACCLGWIWGAAAAQTPGHSVPPAILKTADLLRASQEPVRVVCLGDSVTGVYYHTGGRRAYPEMVQVALQRLYPNAQIEVFNAGIGGNTTGDALNRLDSDVLSRKPHLVTVMFGLNDMTRVPLEVTPWPVEGLTLPQIEESAKKVRDLKPDLVIVAVPIEAMADSKEQFVRSYKWVLSDALSFGHQEWDCMAVVPSVTAPVAGSDAQERDRLARALIWAQDLGMVERNAGGPRPAEEIFTAWLREQIAE